MSHHVPGALGSKWGNPFKVKKANKNSRRKCLKRYEDYVRRNPDLFDAVMELEGKEIGCWCKPYPCHGDILIKLFKERQGTTTCSSRSKEFSDRGNKCQEKENNETIIPLANTSNHPPLRLTGGAENSFDSQESVNLEHLGNDLHESMSEQEIRDALFEAGYTIEVIDDVLAAKVMARSNDPSNSTKSVHSEISGSESIRGSEIDQENISMTDSVGENAFDKLKEIRIKNVNNVTIGTLNINSLAPKFEQLREIIGKNLDILTIQETKLDSSFPMQQFILDGYSVPYRLDRNREGGGVLIYVREDIPSKELKKHNFTENIEGMFIEINLRKTKLLFFGGYRSDHPEYGVSKDDFLEQVRFALDKYSTYDKILLAGDFNIDDQEETFRDFLFEQNIKNLVKEKTCYKSIENPSCIDLFLTNTSLSFQNTTTVITGLSDFHKMVVTVMKTTFPKAKPKIIYYRDYKHFDLYKFRSDLREKLNQVAEKDYFHFELTFLRVLEEHAPMKKKVLRANDKPYMTKALRKAIMRRSALKNKYLKNKSEESLKAFKKQKNFTKRLAKKERVKYFANLDLNKYTDNIKFWNTVKPMFSRSANGQMKITLVENGEVISNDQLNAESFNNFFIDAVSSLAIEENQALLDDVHDVTDPVKKSIQKFRNHPSIIDIKKNVSVTSKFSFSEVDVADMIAEINNLNVKKSGTFMNIPVKRLKEVVDIVAQPLTDIWKVEIVQGMKFASQLKLADITPLHKKLETINKENYRPVSLLPVVSKLFERLMQKQ